MADMSSLSPFPADPEEVSTLDGSASTAPSTPEGSLYLDERPRANVKPLSAAVFDTMMRTPAVRNICCVGAGYVGEFSGVARASGLDLFLVTNHPQAALPLP